MIKLQAVTKCFGDTVALKSLDLEIPAAGVTVLIGPSGCGKSTILRLINGLLEPDRGSVHFDDLQVTEESVLQIRRKMGYVIQDGGLFPHLTARQNVTLMAQHLQHDKAETEQRLEDLMSLTRFPHEGLDRYPTELSGGQRQRVSLMRALILDPDVLLLDEPLGALDPMIRSSLQSELKEIFNKLQKTVVLVTHDMGEAAYLGDRIALLRDGQLVQYGTLDDFQHSPASDYVTEFLNAQRSVVQL